MICDNHCQAAKSLILPIAKQLAAALGLVTALTVTATGCDSGVPLDESKRSEGKSAANANVPVAPSAIISSGSGTSADDSFVVTLDGSQDNAEVNFQTRVACQNLPAFATLDNAGTTLRFDQSKQQTGTFAFTCDPSDQDSGVSLAANTATMYFSLSIFDKQKLTATALQPLAAKPGDQVTLKGAEFFGALRLTVGDQSVTPQVTSPQELSFEMPKVSKLGEVQLALVYDGAALTSTTMLAGDGTLPVIAAPQDLICSDVTYIDATGETVTGSRPCDLAAISATSNSASGNAAVVIPKSLLVPGNIKKGVTVAGIVGTLDDLPPCSAQQPSDCRLAGTDLVAVAKSALKAGNIKRGVKIGAVTGQFPSASYPLPAYTSSTGSDTDVQAGDHSSLTDLASQLTANDTFAFWDATGRRYLGTGDSDLISRNIKKGVELAFLGLTGAFERLKAAAPTGFSATYVSGTGTELSWDAVADAAGYLLVVRGDQPLAFTPQDGEAYAIGDYNDYEVLYVGNGTQFTHADLGSYGYHYYRLYYFDQNNQYSEQTSYSGKAEVATACNGLPGGYWIRIPGNSTYGTQDFCITQYQLSAFGSNETLTYQSVPTTDTVKTNFTHNLANATCAALGANSRLMSNNEYMTIATNAYNVAGNWSTGQVGSGELSYSIGGNGYLLANGFRFYSTNEDHTSDQPIAIEDAPSYAAGTGTYEWPVVTGGNGVTKANLIPQVAIDNEWYSAQGMGTYYLSTSPTYAVLKRYSTNGIFGAGYVGGPDSIDGGAHCTAPVPTP